MELVRDFKHLSKNDVAIAGGKGASLGEMTQAGIPVPPGFVILSSSFNQFIEETEIKADIDSILHKVNTEDVNSVETASEEIKAIILSKNIPKNIEKDILSSFKKLNSKFVAVRSSATSEDSSSAAWAGQLESYLNTTSKDLLENVKKCWASLFTPRAIFYRFEKNLHSTEISVAVVVQKMVESEVSGIAFSVHPVTQDYNQLIIEAGLGLGESIVSGQITPDSYVLEKDKLKAIEKTTAEQTKALVKAEQGGNIWIELGEKGKQQKLTDKQILELSKLIIKIENHYNFPCDIEWAFEKGKFYIVQSRPITTLTEKKQEKEEKHKLSEVDWIKFLDRRRSCFIYYPFIEVEFNLMPKVTGFGYNYHLYKWSGDKGTHYRSASELQRSLDHFLSIVKNNPEKLKKWRDLCIKWDKRGTELTKLFESKKAKSITLKDFKKYYDEFVQVLLYTVTVPYLCMCGIDSALKKGESENNFKKALKILDPLRSFSTYPKLDRSMLTFFWKLLSKETGISDLDLLDKLTPREVIDYTKNKTLPSIEELKKRKNWCIFWNDTEKNEIIFEYDQNSIMKNFPVLNNDDIKIEEGMIKGTVAFPGKVTGIVRRVDNSKDMKKYQKGEIIVSINTNPDLMPALASCSGIITDDGGIMCHAAIVSRELKKPCIIGTKVATSVLKDGDKVELDAHKGIIRILNKEKVSLSEEFLSNVKNEKVFEFPGEFVIPFVTLDWMNYYDNELKMKNIYPILFFKIGKNCNAYISDERYANVAEYTLNNTLQGNFPIKEIKEKYEKAKKRIEKDYKKWHKINSSGKIEESINKLKRSYYDLRELVASTLCIERLDQEIVKKVVSDLKLKVDLDKIWKIANIQDFISFDIKNKQEILKYCKDKREIMKLQFIYINYTFIPDESFLEKEIKNINLNKIKKEIEETKKLVKKNKKEVNRLSKSLNKDEKKLLTYLKWAMSNRDERKEFISKSEVVQLNSMSEIYSSLGLDKNLAPLTRIEDILKGTDYLLKNQEKIRKRKDKFGIIWYNQEDCREIYENIEQEIEILSKKVTSDYKQEDNNICGETGCRGKISGKVKIIISAQQFKDFKEGEILVAPMTRPEFVPLMKKASAIITDEGGITSHAAIVSRELGIPCVIGTKIATKLLKNGDEVEVDADNGIIKILNKKEQLTLTKYMSREHSLFYAHVWNEANRDLFDQTIPGSNVKNMIFLLNKKGVLEVYYELKELDSIFNAVSEGITKNPKKLDEIIENFYIYWNKLLPYIQNKKKVESTKELKEFYQNWTRWWAPMADIFVTPDRENAPKKLRDRALKVREETQEYSDDGDRIFTEFISRKYPQYKEIANLFTPEESFKIDKLSKKEIEKIKQRKNGCAILTLDGKSTFVTLEELDKTLSENKIIRDQLEAKETNQLSGLSACPGIVKGNVRLVLTKKDLDKVQKGEIMVTYATSPDYVPAMKLCSGIITDEGGVVCHAAIVSRELKIPCIVGTKLATSTLKNGDLVELDASKGTVKILKKA